MSETAAMTEMAAKVPPNRLPKSRPTVVRDMPVGEEWYILFTDVVVRDGRAWVDATAAPMPRGMNRVRLRRDVRGLHMTIEDDSLHFTDIPGTRPNDLLPILSITEVKEARADAPLGAAIRDLMTLRSELERACRDEKPEEIRRLARLLVGLD
jgi:hypothetical protein